MASILGILSGLAGSALLIFNESSTISNVNIGIGLLLVLGTVMYGINANVINTQLRSLHPLDLSSSSFAIASIPCIVYLFLQGDISSLIATPEARISLGYISILVLVGTVGATLLFFKLIQMTNAVFGTLVAYFIPIVAMFWGALDGESIGLVHIFGVGMILSGVYLIRSNDP